ncbi:MAG: hypothetical protein JWO67_6720 [Streptosporangiaceae bacterium]|nr:hypothetical protein [Streptosporangiaceae bacterium]
MATPEYTVLGMKLDTEHADLAQPLAALVVVKGLDAEGRVAYWAMATEDIQTVEALGMANYAKVRLEKSLADD